MSHRRIGFVRIDDGGDDGDCQTPVPLNRWTLTTLPTVARVDDSWWRTNLMPLADEEAKKQHEHTKLKRKRKGQ